MFLCLEIGVHLRHLRNVSLIREIRKSGGVDGQISYRKWFSYRISASEFHIFSALFLLIAVLTYSPFFLGGAIMCFANRVQAQQVGKKGKINRCRSSRECSNQSPNMKILYEDAIFVSCR